MTRAVQIAELGDQNTLNINATNNRVGIGSTQPTVKLDVVGVISATSFSGDGSGLTGVANTGTILSDSITVAGITTVDASGVNVTGVVTATGFSGNVVSSAGTITTLSATTVSIAGTLTYNDVTNIDAVGIITARSGVNVSGNGLVVVGVSTFNDDIKGDNATNISGISSVTATLYYGSGKNLTNLPASGDSNDITACLFL